jgi:hypothetical protein
MSPGDAIKERLLATGGVTALVGQRVYRIVIPQHEERAAIRIQQIDETTGYHLRGETKPGVTRVQVDVYESTSSGGNPLTTATAGAEVVHDALSGEIFEGAGLQISGCFRKDTAELYESGVINAVGIRQDYDVHYRSL